MLESDELTWWVMSEFFSKISVKTYIARLQRYNSLLNQKMRLQVEIFTLVLLFFLGFLVVRKQTGEIHTRLFGKNTELYRRIAFHTLIVVFVVFVSWYHKCSWYVIALKIFALPTIHLSAIGWGEIHKDIVNNFQSSGQFMSSFLYATWMAVTMIIVMWSPRITEEKLVFMFVFIVSVYTVVHFHGAKKDIAK